MIIICPECSTRYNLGPAAIPPEGRRVRCVKCSFVWLQEPPKSFGTAPLAEPSELPPPSPAAFRNEFESRPPEPDVPTSAFRMPTVDEEDSKPRFSPTHLGWAALAGVVLLIIGSLILFSGSIVTVWPATARLYALFGGAELPKPIPLQINQISTSKGQADGQPTLSIAGLVSNHTQVEQPVPDLRLVLHRADATVLKSVDFPADQSSVAPGAAVPFKTTVVNPPSDAVSADVTFAVK